MDDKKVKKFKFPIKQSKYEKKSQKHITLKLMKKKQKQKQNTKKIKEKKRILFVLEEKYSKTIRELKEIER